MLTAINIPRIRVTRYSQIDGMTIFWVWMSCMAMLLVLIGVVTFTYRQVRWDHMPPPRVITKVVTKNGLTSAQNTYIKQCETNHIVPTNSQIDSYGIPNVEVTPWTCTFAAGQGQG